MIKAQNLTKDYGEGRGIFNLNFHIPKGQVVGFLGPNGAGKTTTIRFLLGLISSKNSKASISELDCFSEQALIQKFTGYLPGELTFIDGFNGEEFLHFMAGLKGVDDLSYAKKLIHIFELKLDMPIKKMSKGMKQKLGIIIAFMDKPEVLLLDEPSSGLDPLMQQRLIELILEHKKLGATIFLSSHIFEEVEKTCDRVMIIKNGHIVEDNIVEEIKAQFGKEYLIEFKTNKDAKAFINQYGGKSYSHKKVSFLVETNVNDLIQYLTQYEVIDVSRKNQSIEEIFLKYYGDNND